MTEKRKAKFSIVTNEMTDEVYDVLLSKVKDRKLTPFIIELVQKHIRDEKSVYDKVESLENEINQQRSLIERFDSLEQQIKMMSNKIDNVSSFKADVISDYDEESSLAAEIKNNEIVGEMDEDPNDMDF